MPIDPATNKDWRENCIKERGKVLTGKYCHWCMEWDELPIDETTPEWPCGCLAMVQRIENEEREALAKPDADVPVPPAKESLAVRVLRDQIKRNDVILRIRREECEEAAQKIAHAETVIENMVAGNNKLYAAIHALQAAARAEQEELSVWKIDDPAVQVHAHDERGWKPE